jgi:hypothetical protein
MVLAWSDRYDSVHHHQAARRSELGDKAWAVEEKGYAHYALFVPIRILSSHRERWRNRRTRHCPPPLSEADF